MASNLTIAVAGILFATGPSAGQVAFATIYNSKICSLQPIIQKIKKQDPQLGQRALMAGVRAYRHLRSEGKDPRQLLTIINFNRPSNEKRLWIFDMATGNTEYFTYVAQGVNTGSNIAKYFSNIIGSHESSIGVYLTGKTYYGVDGYSLRLHGLDKGFNNNAFKRDIVMHPAWHVSKHFVERYGRLGHTYGCFGLNQSLAPKIISAIKNGTVMVAYYPSKQWLAGSQYEQPIKP